jgi:hypothetical protein
VPLHTAIREAGATAIPIPEFIMRSLFARLFALGLIAYPPGAIDYLKYPLTLSGDRFVEATGFRPLFSLEETLHSVRA